MEILNNEGSFTLNKHINAIQIGLLWLVFSGGGGGVFHLHPVTSVFKVRRLKFRTELLWGRINILGQEKSGSNR